MKAKDIMNKWVKEQEGMLQRAKILAKTITEEVGDQEIDIESLREKAMAKYQRMDYQKLICTFATDTTVVVYAILENLTKGGVR